MKPKRKTALKKKIKRKKGYFFTEDEKALAVPLGKGQSSVWKAEDKARTIALKKKLKLAGGLDVSGGKKPDWVKGIINVPFKTKPTPKPRDIVDDIMDYETGQMSEAKMKKMFQKMVNTGQVWKLQGHYGRTADALLKAGVIKYPKKKTTDYYGNPIPTRK